MKGYDSRISWIGGEGLQSKYQVKEKLEQRYPQVCLSQAKPHERFTSYKVFHIVFMCLYTSHSGDRRVYVGVKKEKCIHLKKNEDLGRTVDHTFPSFFALVFLSVDHYPCYKSFDFSIIKSFSTLVFPPRFFQGY